MRSLAQNLLQPIVLFSLLWYVVPLVALVEAIRRWLTHKPNLRPYAYLFLASIDLWAFMLANTIPGKVLALVGTVAILPTVAIDDHGCPVDGTLYGYGLLLIDRSFGIVPFVWMNRLFLGFTVLVILWVLWQVRSDLRQGNRIGTYYVVALAGLLGATVLWMAGNDTAGVGTLVVGVIAMLVAVAAFLWSGDDRDAKAVSALIFLSDFLMLLSWMNPHS